MGVQFREDHSHEARFRMLRVVIPTPSEPLHLVIGRNPIFWRTVALHWDTDLKRNVPCTGEECVYCPQPTRECTYVPCLLAKGASPGGRFGVRVVPVSDGWADMLDQDHAVNVYRVVRQARSHSCRWSVASTLAAYGLTPYEGQEIEPTLFRMWGIRR